MRCFDVLMFWVGFTPLNRDRGWVCFEFKGKKSTIDGET